MAYGQAAKAFRSQFSFSNFEIRLRELVLRIRICISTRTHHFLLDFGSPPTPQFPLFCVLSLFAAALHAVLRGFRSTPSRVASVTSCKTVKRLPNNPNFLLARIANTCINDQQWSGMLHRGKDSLALEPGPLGSRHGHFSFAL